MNLYTWYKVIAVTDTVSCLLMLQLLEPRFSCENLATILNIPTSKSLLRRHLAAHFAALVGMPALTKKDMEMSEGRGLTVAGKVKRSGASSSKKYGE